MLLFLSLEGKKKIKNNNSIFCLFCVFLVEG